MIQHDVSVTNAKYHGTCQACRKHVYPGDRVELEKRRVLGTRHVRHVGCRVPSPLDFDSAWARATLLNGKRPVTYENFEDACRVTNPGKDELIDVEFETIRFAWADRAK